MALKNAPIFVDGENPLARKVIAYSDRFKAAVDTARDTGDAPDWSAFRELIAVDTFERVGVYKESMTWPVYEAFLTEFATMAAWKGVFRRVTEVDRLVILELEEHNTIGEHTDVSNTVTIYAFDDAGKICHLDVYLQSAAIRPKG